MKIRHFYLAMGMVSAMYGATAQAGTCEVSITRTACPGNEELSFKKCNGKASCSDFQEAATADACAALATAECANNRLTITKSKVITATFDGAPVAAGADLCQTYANRATEFDKCQ